MIRTAPLWVALACSDDLLPHETVLGVDQPVVVTFGGEGSELGASVAWNGVDWAAAAPGGGGVWVSGEPQSEVGGYGWVGWYGDQLVRGGRDGVQIGAEPAGWQFDLFAASESGVFGYFSASSRLCAVASEACVTAYGVFAIGAGEAEVAALECEGECGVMATSVEAVGLRRVAFDGEYEVGGPGGAIAFDAGAICVGNPELDVPDGAGSVSCDDGRFVEGEPGDHLGSAIGGGFAAGTFNKWVVPPRARIVPLDGGEAFVLEEGAENQSISLAGDDSTLVVGAPFHPHGGFPSGAVFVVAR